MSIDFERMLKEVGDVREGNIAKYKESQTIAYDAREMEIFYEIQKLQLATNVVREITEKEFNSLYIQNITLATIEARFRGNP